jgi:2,3-bisphosphoglycerate-dependent phosphoglycerate mutase
VVERVVPYWKSEIAPALINNKKIIVAASGNSLRALLKHIENMSEKDIVEFNFPTGIPLVCELDDNLKLVKRYFLAEPEELRLAIEAVANQGKIK